MITKGKPPDARNVHGKTTQDIVNQMCLHVKLLQILVQNMYDSIVNLVAETQPSVRTV